MGLHGQAIDDLARSITRLLESDELERELQRAIRALLVLAGSMLVIACCQLVGLILHLTGFWSGDAGTSFASRRLSPWSRRP